MQIARDPTVHVKKNIYDRDYHAEKRTSRADSPPIKSNVYEFKVRDRPIPHEHKPAIIGKEEHTAGALVTRRSPAPSNATKRVRRSNRRWVDVCPLTSRQHAVVARLRRYANQVRLPDYAGGDSADSGSFG